MSDTDPVVPCPICGRPSTTRFRPFCSLRCADADLGSWFTGQYRIPGPPEEDPEPAARQPLDPDKGVR